MSLKTAIAWTDHTFNPWWGCTKIDPGCAHCYADIFSTRLGLDVWGPQAKRRIFGEKHWREPILWNQASWRTRNLQAAMLAPAAMLGVRGFGKSHLVFCGSMCDWAEDHPTAQTERPKLWQLIRDTPHLDWQLLTKRADRIAQCLPLDWCAGYPNVWLGVSVSEEKGLWRVDELRKIPAIRFVSYEPALGPIADKLDLTGIHWLIYGGESGPGFRPEDKQWARDVRALCQKSGTAFFHKQSAAPRTEMGIQLDGQIIREFPR